MVDKISWFKQEKKEFFKGVPKKDGSGKGIRLNKGRGKCPLEEQKDFSEKALKTALTLPIVVGGILVGTKLLDSIGE